MFISGIIKVIRIRLTVFMEQQLSPVKLRKNGKRRITASDQNDIFLKGVAVVINAIQPYTYTACGIGGYIQERGE